MIRPRTEPSEEVLSQDEIDTLHGDDPGTKDPRAISGAALEGRSGAPEIPGLGSSRGSSRDTSRDDSRHDDAAVVVSADVLVALRSLDEGRTVVRELRESGHTVACVRNPFRALDELRVRPRDALITDIDLWVDDGALLFDRLHSAGASTHVIFIGDDASTLAERARRSGADAAIARPWSSGDVQARLRDLLCAVSSPSSDDSRSPGAGGNEGDFDDSRPWLRFFFDARRELRETVEPSERLAVLVDLVLTRLDADAVVEMAETSRGPRVVVHTNRNGTVDVSERVAERVRELLSAPIPPDPVLDTRGAIFLPLAQGRGSISIELSRPLPASIEDFVQELGIVFREELARD